jgi:hypothetical protein
MWRMMDHQGTGSEALFYSYRVRRYPILAINIPSGKGFVIHLARPTC